MRWKFGRGGAANGRRFGVLGEWGQGLHWLGY